MSRTYLNDSWYFSTEYKDAMIQSDYDESSMESIRLPHTCREVPFHYFDEQMYQMVCGYRRSIFAPETWRDKSVVLTFEGVAHSAQIFINGELVKEHYCGYTACSVEIGEQLNYGQNNQLTVRVNSREDQNIPPFGYVIDYMTFGGIYRDVYLDVREKEYVEDIFVKTILPPGLKSHPDRKAVEYYPAKIVSLIQIHSDDIQDPGKEPLYIRQKLLKRGNEEIALGETEISGHEVELEESVADILLWELDAPCLYELKTELVRSGKVIDTRVDTFGFRKVEFETDGFYLNGNKVKIRGLNRHQSYPYVGYAMPESMQKQDAEILKQELGCNAVRTSHYPQSQYFIERCDEIGLLVFMEIPGWQHIGGENWKKQAIQNVKDMIRQYRNHPSIILWGVRINESRDDDEFYIRTNEAAHELDDTRPTGGVRAHKKSHLFEDVYTYNDFSHDGKAPGCEPKKNITSDRSKPYLISEYNGHMYPTKAFDDEEQRREHALRHARVLDAVAGQKDIAGCFGWCMFDYNTHKDFGSGDRICYHGVMDMFRNPKMAAYVYACEAGTGDTVLELSSSMDIGEHPGCNRGATYIFSNADSVKMYKNDHFIKEYTRKDSPFQNLKHGPILIDDFIGDEIKKNGNFTEKQAEEIKSALNYTALHGYGHYPMRIMKIALKALLFYHMKPEDAVTLYNSYVGDWGGSSTTYRFEAIKDGRIAKTIIKKPMTAYHMELAVSSRELCEQRSYDVAEVRIVMRDENGNQLFYFEDPVLAETEGPIKVIGPEIVPVRGGMTGIYVKSLGESGKAALTLRCLGTDPVRIGFEVICPKDSEG